MKIVINDCFGGFGIKKSIAKKYGFDRYNESRTNQKLIELIESGVDCDNDYSRLTVVTIPNNVTDWELDDYDGSESIIYVVDGKIHHL